MSLKILSVIDVFMEIILGSLQLISCRCCRLSSHPQKYSHLLCPHRAVRRRPPDGHSRPAGPRDDPGAPEDSRASAWLQ